MFMWLDMNFVLEKNGDHKPSDLGMQQVNCCDQAS